MKTLTLSLTVLFATIWGGAYLATILPPGSWTIAPLGITLGLVGGAAALCAVFGAVAAYTGER